MFGGEQRARFVQSSPAKAGYATAGRMTVFSVTLDDNIFVLSILPMENNVQGSSG